MDYHGSRKIELKTVIDTQKKWDPDNKTPGVILFLLIGG